jgi:hypothetical protein
VRRQNPQARIVITGCYAQRDPQEIASIEGVNAVVGNSHKSLVPEVAGGIAENPAGAQQFVPLSVLTPSPSKILPKIFVDETFALKVDVRGAIPTNRMMEVRISPIPGNSTFAGQTHHEARTRSFASKPREARYTE